MITASIISYSGARGSQGWLGKSRNGDIALAFSFPHPIVCTTTGSIIHGISYPTAREWSLQHSVRPWCPTCTPIPTVSCFPGLTYFAAHGVEIQTKLSVTKSVFHRSSKIEPQGSGHTVHRANEKSHWSFRPHHRRGVCLKELP